MWRPGSYESNMDSLLEPQRHITLDTTFRIQLSDKNSRLRTRKVIHSSPVNNTGPCTPVHTDQAFCT